MQVSAAFAGHGGAVEALLMTNTISSYQDRVYRRGSYNQSAKDNQSLTQEQAILSLIYSVWRAIMTDFVWLSLFTASPVLEILAECDVQTIYAFYLRIL